MKYCTNCGSANNESNEFCVNCGAKFTEVIDAPKEVMNISNTEQDTEKSDVPITLPTQMKQDNKRLIMSIIGIIFMILMLIPIVQAVHSYNNRIQIGKIVHQHFDTEDVTCKVDKKRKMVEIIPKDNSRMYSTVKTELSNINYGEDDYSYLDEQIKPAMSDISYGVKKDVGKEWAILFINPLNHKRMLFRYEDGNETYSIY